MEILSQASDYVAPAISIPIILGIVYWVSKTRVDIKTCDRTHEAVNKEHMNLRAYIKDAETRAEDRHKELVELIKNNGHGKPRIRT
jgi:hypothetical protein